MTKYKLWYFDARGRAEAIRQVFVIADIQYEDRRIDAENEWSQYKKEMPYGQVPVLEVDGVQLAQSVAILRYIGHKFNMGGKDELQNAKLDMIADLITDIMNAEGVKQWPYVLLGIEKTDKAQYFATKVRPTIESYAPHIEKQLLENRNGLLLGEKVTWVDVYAAEFFSKVLDYGQADCLDAYPHIKQIVSRIHNLPAMRDYLKNRKPSKC